MFFLTGVTNYLGEGGTERAAAYVLPIGLAIAGVVLWRLTSREAGPDSGRELTRREERERARAEQAARDRERDAALEGAARRPPRARRRAGRG